ncbi:hypothetical protein F4V43_00520 [Paenibacillus spiritus]|uniref:Uncharacterized protein n=1 Tax=Paenibacillus spiritus TaxID=2496557 RepID=A0A5J5GK62_9BACL|nr:hypothetical protein [Paenibacillus spiritus]KAA9008649.1 hypothetical protein F4V43_00520 [Paenibacillus spiritus]
MPFLIRDDIKSYINAGLLRAFAKKHEIDSRGLKNNLIRNIEIAVEEGKISEDQLKIFIKEQLWYGKNKHNFFIEIDEETADNLQSKEYLDQYLQDRGQTVFNNIDRINLPEGVALSRFEYELVGDDNNKIKKIYVGYIEKNFLQKFVDKEPVFTPVNTYVCCELDLENNMLLLRIRSQSQIKIVADITEKSINVNYIAKKYMERLTTDFGIGYLDGGAERIKNKMFKIERQLTNFIELQFQPQVQEYNDIINEFTKDIAEKLGLPSDIQPINLRDRIMGLLERALIVQNESVIESYVEGKVGYVNKFDFRDDRGGRINARTEEKSKPIQTSDIFFDTRETINEVRLIDAIWVVWFRVIEDTSELVSIEPEANEEDGEVDLEEITTEEHEKVIKLGTRIAAYKGFYKIEFTHYVLKEDYEHVLSLIDSFE